MAKGKGRLLVSCEPKEDNAKAKKMYRWYTLKKIFTSEVKSIIPRVKISRLSQKYSNEELCDF